MGGSEQRKSSALNRPSTVTEDKGDTFLTDMLFKGKEKITPAKQSKQSKPVLSAKGQRQKNDLKKQEKASEIDSDEYQDMVYDIDYGK